MKQIESQQNFHDFMSERFAMMPQAANSDELMLARQLKNAGIGICTEDYEFTRFPSYVGIDGLKKVAIDYFQRAGFRLLKEPKPLPGELVEFTRKSRVKLEFVDMSNGRYGCVMINYPKPTETSRQICRVSVHRTDDWGAILEDKVKYLGGFAA